MTFTILPLSVGFDDLDPPSRDTLRRLWVAFDLESRDLEERNRTYIEITQFISRWVCARRDSFLYRLVRMGGNYSYSVPTSTLNEGYYLTDISIDPYDPAQPRIPYDQELFHAHMAHAFRHSRVTLFIAIPALIEPMRGAQTVGDTIEIMRNINWYAAQLDRTVREAVSGAIQEKELGNTYATLLRCVLCSRQESRGEEV